MEDRIRRREGDEIDNRMFWRGLEMVMLESGDTGKTQMYEYEALRRR